MTEKKRIATALDLAHQYSQIDGSHHKAWTIDQMVRALTGCQMEDRIATDARGKIYVFQTMGESAEYREFVRRHNKGDDGPDTYGWDEGIAP